MAIKGLSEQRRCPRLGKIRLGLKVEVKGKSGVMRPTEIDYFLLDPNTGTEERNDQLKRQFYKIYGEKPKSMQVMFPPVDKDVFFQQWYKRYGSGTLLKCKGDGEEAICSQAEFAEGLDITGHTAQGFVKVKCLGAKCIHQSKEQEKRPSCSRTASLQVLLPELDAIGVWEINTRSYNSIININSAIEWIQGLCGRFSMIPVTLYRAPQAISHEGKKTNHYILQVDMQGSLIKLQKKALIAPEKSMLTALPLPEETTPDDTVEDAVIVEGDKVHDAKVPETVNAAAKAVGGEIVFFDLGDLSRFKDKKASAESLQKVLKQLHDDLGGQEFMRVLSTLGYGSVTTLNTVAEITAFVNCLIEEKKQKGLKGKK